MSNGVIDRLLFLVERYPLDFISHLSSGLPIIIGLIRWQFLPHAYKVIMAFFFFYFLKDSLALWLSLLKSNNLFIQNAETIIETLLLLVIYLYYFKNHPSKGVGILFAGVCTVVSLYTYQNDQVSSSSLSAFRLFAIFFTLSYFNKIITDISIKNILLHSMFWFAAGLLIYAAGTFFIVLFSEYWYNDINKVPADVFDKYWNVSQILFILFSSLSAYGLWFSKCDVDNLT